MSGNWFAWYPVRAYHGKWVWLRTVFRMKRHNAGKGPETSQSWWEYYP